MYKILISDKLPGSAIQILQDASNYEVILAYDKTQEELQNLIPGYHALIIRSATVVNKELIDHAANLKVIGRAGSGLDNIDVSYAREKGIEVLNTPGSNSRAVAELTIALMFDLSRNLYEAIHSLKEERWEKSKFQGGEVLGKTIGLLGFGRIGTQVGRMAAGLGLDVLVYKSSPMTKSPGFSFELVEMDELLTRSDYISLHLPKTDATNNLIRLQELKKMKRTAYLINCARGGIVNENDLLSALNQNLIAGCALDVFSSEPVKDFQLIRHPKVIATPHIGAATHESQQRVGLDIVDSVMKFLEKNFLFIGRK